VWATRPPKKKSPMYKHLADALSGLTCQNTKEMQASDRADNELLRAFDRLDDESFIAEYAGSPAVPLSRKPFVVRDEAESGGLWQEDVDADPHGLVIASSALSNDLHVLAHSTHALTMANLESKRHVVALKILDAVRREMERDRARAARSSDLLKSQSTAVGNPLSPAIKVGIRMVVRMVQSSGECQKQPHLITIEWGA
jgi:hypothetical protein